MPVAITEHSKETKAINRETRHCVEQKLIIAKSSTMEYGYKVSAVLMMERQTTATLTIGNHASRSRNRSRHPLNTNAEDQSFFFPVASATTHPIQENPKSLPRVKSLSFNKPPP
jgi:hypothetical protein